MPGVQGQINKEKDKIRKMIKDKFSITNQVNCIHCVCVHTKPQYTSLPKNGIPREEVLRMMKDMKQKEDPHWKSGKISGMKSFQNKILLQQIRRCLHC